jgi:hypothetical protein
MASDRGVYGTEPVYERLSFCNSPDALWAKLVTGGWDWLGVKPDDRTFVLGAPSRSTGFVAMAAATVTKAGAVPGQFGVRVRVPRFPGTSDAVRMQREMNMNVPWKRLVKRASLLCFVLNS